LEQAVRLISDAHESAARSPAASLSLARLALVNFRSYTEAELAVEPVPVVLAGANGTGKTNCLEAISLLSPGRGLRGANLAEIQRKGPHPAPESEGGVALWAVGATIARDGDSWSIATELAPPVGANPRRVMRLNGAPAQTGDIAELAPMLWLTPAQDRLFLEGASERRRFLDRLVYGLDAGHAHRATRYERAMRERLKLLRDGVRDPVWLDGLERTMAESGTAISEARAAMIERLNAELAERARQSAFPCAHLTLAGDEDDVGADPARLQSRLAGTRRHDAESGRTNAGPHLADMAVRHTAKRADARDCSTGEQKALLISMVLANAWLQKRRNDGAAPFLLLDEVAAHLDATRRAALFDEILCLSAQAWMTGTDKSLFSPLKGRASLFAVEDGRFARQEF
jgi:DNA replication and repair protein RecF